MVSNSHNTISRKSHITLFALLLCICIASSPITTYAADFTFTAEEKEQLQKIALAEAESEGVWGQALVMYTILNRVDSPDFPDTIEEVIKQENQFAAYSGGRYDEAEPNETSQEALNLLPDIKNEGWLYFEVTSEDSWQSRNLEFICEYRRHSFYKIKEK